jgi:hypothetical protein
VPFDELLAFYAEAATQLHNMADGSTFKMRLVD